MKIILSLIVIPGLVIGAYYFLSRPSYAPQPSPKTSTESSVSPTPTEREASPTAESPKEIKVEMKGLKFVPAVVRIKAGEKVKLTLTSDVTHTYTIDKLGLNFRLRGDEVKSFDLMVEKPGTYEVYCSIPSHKEGGMVGMLVVE